MDAKEVWIKEMQQRFSSMQLKQLEHSLGLFVDTKGIIRSRGRIAKANLPYRNEASCIVILKPSCNRADSEKLLS